MNLNGQDVTQDAAEAVRWWRLAADQGDAEAQYTKILVNISIAPGGQNGNSG